MSVPGEERPGTTRIEEAPTPLRHRIEYAGFRLLRGVFSSLPLPMALGVGTLLGWLAGSVLRIRRDVVEENLARAFPEKDEAWRRRVAARSYRHLGRESVMTFLISRSDPARIREMSTVESGALDELRADLARGGGVVMASGHLGNWEMAGAAMAARGFPVDAVAQLQRNRRFDEDLRGARRRLGMTVMSKQEAPRGVLRSLAQGRMPALVADQNVARAGIFVDFFGVPAATARGPALFALRTGAPLWVGVGVTRSGRPHGYEVLLRRVETLRTGNPEVDVPALIQAYLGILEEWIRRDPAQYFWQHKRWKTRPAIPEPRAQGDHITP